MDRKSVEGLLSNSKNRKIFIIGDVMLDKYMMGEVTRVSPEAPVQVFDIKKTEYKLGGAANVSHNVNSLGAYPFLIGVIGDDEEATMFKDVMGGFGQNTGVDSRKRTTHDSKNESNSRFTPSFENRQRIQGRYFGGNRE